MSVYFDELFLWTYCCFGPMGQQISSQALACCSTHGCEIGILK